MRMDNILNAVKFCGLTLVVCLGSVMVDCSAYGGAGEFHPVDPNRVRDVLTMIYSQVHNNYNAIKTWQGEMDSTLEYISEGPEAEKIFKTYTNGIGDIPKIVKRRVECSTEFAVNIERDLLYVSDYWGKPAQYTDLESGRDLGSKSIPDFKRSIVTPEYYIYSSPNTTREGVIVNRKAVKEVLQQCTTCETPSVFDPRELFGLPLQPVWEAFPRMLKVISEHGEYNVDGYVLKVEERTGNGITEYRITKPGRRTLEPDKSKPDNYLFLKRIFSSDKGFNVVLKELCDTEGVLLQKQTWDYDLVDGVYIPTRTSVQNYERETGMATFEKIEVFKNLKINRPISSEVFSYKNLGLENGDKFIDKIEGKEYRYQDANLAPITNEDQ